MQNNILDDIEYQIRRHSVFDRDEKYISNVLWSASSYFLKYQNDIKVFRAFPMLAFMSPEPDSGKSRSLKVTELLSCNSISAGKYTTASLLFRIDEEPDKILSIFLDEMDTIFAHGKDNSELIQLFNLGYEAGAVIVRLKRFGEGLRETPAYCPKAFAGLRIARIPGPTKTRTIIINMRPKTDSEIVERYIDMEGLAELNKKLEIWSHDPATLDRLRNVDLKEASFLTNRNEQIWQPLLAIAKITSEEWYQRAIAAARYFTTGRQTGEDLTHKILLGTYRVFRSGKYLDKIHSMVLREELYDLGVIPKWVDQNHLADHLSSYDPEIVTRQIKIDGINRMGYEWHKFINTFNTYLTGKEIRDVEKELGLIPVEAVDPVDPSGNTRGPSYGLRPSVRYPLPPLPPLPKHCIASFDDFERTLSS
jgi:Protein of unknown function (DUF3631)